MYNDNKSNEKWFKDYTKAIDLYNGENDLNDSQVIELLNSSHREGLNIFSNRLDFLRSSQILAKLYFKYKNYKLAENNLLIIREIKDLNIQIPIWVSLYSIITYYKLNLVSVILKPHTFFSEFDNIEIINNDEKVQIRSIIEDLLNNIAEYKSIKPELRYEVFENFFFSWKEKNINIFEENSNLNPFSLDIPNVVVPKDIDKYINQLQSRIKDLEFENGRLQSELIKFVHKKVIPVENPIISELKLYKKSRNLLIVTDKNLSKEIIIGICKNYGFDKKNITIYDEYGKLPFNIESIRYNSPYDGIIFGPVPHSAPGKGKHSSLIEMVKNEEGYPHVEESKTMSGELKMTKESLKNALNRLNTYLEAIN